MSTSTASALDLKNNYTAVSETYRGTDLDIHEVCREQLLKSPIYEGDFITQFGVPTNAGIQQGTRPTFALFKYQDVMAVLRDGNTYTSGFIAEGLGAFFDGLVILAMDGEAHRKVRALLQPAFMPESVNKWRGQIDEAIREEYLKPLVPQKKADLMEFGLELPIRIMYALMGFPTDDPSSTSNTPPGRWPWSGATRSTRRRWPRRASRPVSRSRACTTPSRAWWCNAAPRAAMATTWLAACCVPNTKGGPWTTMRSSPSPVRCCPPPVKPPHVCSAR